MLFSVVVVENLKSIRNDTTYIRQMIQLEDEPVDPFYIVTIARDGDTTQVLCDPQDTLSINKAIEDGYKVHFELVE